MNLPKRYCQSLSHSSWPPDNCLDAANFILGPSNHSSAKICVFLKFGIKRSIKCMTFSDSRIQKIVSAALFWKVLGSTMWNISLFVFSFCAHAQFKFSFKTFWEQIEHILYFHRSVHINLQDWHKFYHPKLLAIVQKMCRTMREEHLTIQLNVTLEPPSDGDSFR